MGNFYAILFPHPEPAFYKENNVNLYWIPSKSLKKEIPILFYNNQNLIDSPEPSNLLIFFHGNAEDAGIAFNFVE